MNFRFTLRLLIQSSRSCSPVFASGRIIRRRRRVYRRRRAIRGGRAGGSQTTVRPASGQRPPRSGSPAQRPQQRRASDALARVGARITTPQRGRPCRRYSCPGADDARNHRAVVPAVGRRPPPPRGRTDTRTADRTPIPRDRLPRPHGNRRPPQRTIRLGRAWLHGGGRHARRGKRTGDQPDCRAGLCHRRRLTGVARTFRRGRALARARWAGSPSQRGSRN